MKRRPLMGWYTWTDSRHNARHILYHRNWKKGQPWPRCKQNFITIISLSMIFIPPAHHKPIQALNSRNFQIAFRTRPSHRMLYSQTLTRLYLEYMKHKNNLVLTNYITCWVKVVLRLSYTAYPAWLYSW